MSNNKMFVSKILFGSDSENYSKFYDCLYNLNLSEGAIVLYTILENKFEYKKQRLDIDSSGKFFFSVNIQEIQDVRGCWSLHEISRYLKELADNDIITMRRDLYDIRIYVSDNDDMIFRG